jgi:phosphoglycolate phosphatase
MSAKDYVVTMEMRMQYNTFLFDFDYTLADATDGIVASFNDGFVKLNLPQCSVESIRRTIGLTLKEAFIQLTNCDDDDTIQRFIGFFRNKADEVMAQNTVLYGDTITTLRFLKVKGMKVGIVTTKYHYRIAEILGKYSISDLVDTIIGGEDVLEQKPSPEGILLAISKLNSKTENVLYIGDSLVDAKAAQAAGVDFAAVTTGTTLHDEFLVYPHIHIVNNLSEIISVLSGC